MSRFDDRYGKSRHPDEHPVWSRPGGRFDDTRYPGDEFGGTYGRHVSGDGSGSPYRSEREMTGGRDYGPGDDFSGGAWAGGRHGSGDDYRRHPGHRDFGRHGGEGAHWSRSGHPGGYRGIGPKGYERSDERIREDVCERLAEHDAIDASGIDVRVSSGTVQLTGEVPRRAMIHLAEDTVAETLGVKDVENTLRVRAQERREGPSGTSDDSAA